MSCFLYFGPCVTSRIKTDPTEAMHLEQHAQHTHTTKTPCGCEQCIENSSCSSATQRLSSFVYFPHACNHSHELCFVSLFVYLSVYLILPPSPSLSLSLTQYRIFHREPPVKQQDQTDNASFTRPHCRGCQICPSLSPDSTAAKI